MDWTRAILMMTLFIHFLIWERRTRREMLRAILAERVHADLRRKRKIQEEKNYYKEWAKVHEQ